MAVAERQAKFVEGNLLRHITVMSLTASVGLMAIFAVDLMNMVFISWLKDEEITAAVGYAGAVLFFTTAFGIGLSIAVSAHVARAVGMRDLALAREKATSGLILGIGIGVVFSAVVWAVLPQITGLLGATGRTAELAVHFLRIVVPAQPFLMIGMIGGAILRSHGDARRAMMATVWGAVVNAALDPLFIFTFDWGLTGAAWASVASRMVIAGMALVPIWRHYGGFVRPVWTACAPMCRRFSTSRGRRS
jgi:Na+-driven multidrug efflux pump